jgi:hypothetical protein
MDKGYDLATLYDGCEPRDLPSDQALRQTPDVKRGGDKPAMWEHGGWRFARTDSTRGATKGPLPNRPMQAH